MNDNEKVYFSNSYKCRAENESQLDEMVRRGWVYVLGDGRISYGKEVKNIMKKIDDKIMSWAIEDNAWDICYPDFYRMKDLVQCDYITQFHPHCFFASTSNIDMFEQLQIESTDFVNNPAVCMHSYIQYRDSIIKEDEPIVITSKGKCKRKEHTGYISMERLLDFTMREIIFMGTETYVLNKRNEYMKRSKQLITEMELDGNISVANDPFFKKEDKVKADFQRKFKLKYEMHLKIPYNEHMIAVGSFNYHGTNFSKAYNIKDSNNHYVHTACMAFGMERFAYACIEQKGIDSIDDLII